jgi:hypothetical protein
MNAQDEINKAIGVVKARMDYVIRYEDSEGDSLEEWDALCKAICSLEKWRDGGSTGNLPETPRQMIWFKQQAQLCCKENGYAIV